jgi:ADP-heptose:LPS heptosyltransferase
MSDRAQRSHSSAAMNFSSRFIRSLLSAAEVPPATQTGARFLFLNYERALGYAALATATFAALKQRRPDARIAVAACGLTANLLRDSPFVDELIVTPHAITATPRAMAFFLTRIHPRRREFDYVVADAANPRTRISLLALASGVARRVGFSLQPALFHRPLAFDRRLGNIANNLRVLDAVGLPGPPTEPQIHFAPADLAKAQALLSQAPESLPAPRIAMVTQVSGAHPNQWFDDRWAELSRRLTQKLGAQLIFVGTAADTVAIDALRGKLSVPSYSVAGRTDIPQVAAVLALCDLVVTIDTGTLHVARAVAAPCVVIGHAATPKHSWLPLGDPRYRILLHDEVPCAGCLKHFCATRECMQENTVDLVEAAILAQLAAFPPSRDARAERAAARTSRRQPVLN